MNNLLIALQITALGMGLVFAAILVLWGMMNLLTFLTADKEPDVDPDASSKAAPTGDDDLRARAAAVAVAIALAQQTSSAHCLAEPPTAIVSAWQLGMRTRQMYQKGSSMRRRARLGAAIGRRLPRLLPRSASRGLAQGMVDRDRDRGHVVDALLADDPRSRVAVETLVTTGLVVVAGSMALLVAGLLGAELFLSRVSLIGAVAGSILFLFGWQRLRIMLFPLAFLLLMVPLPALIFNKIAFPLQLVASHVGERTISSLDIPILREGNVLILANATLEVAEACSGIRSLVSLITLGLVYGYFIDHRLWVRLLIVASTVPVAIIANGARVAGTGMAAHWIGEEAAQGFFHQFSGWIVFVVAFAMILLVQRVIGWIAPKPVVVPAPAGASA